MTRQYTTTVINDVTYELHGVKVDKKSIGSVPVRMFSPDKDPFDAFVQNTTPGEFELVVEDYKYGLAVRLQGMARKCVTGDGYTEADHNKVFNELSVADPEWLSSFVGKGDALDKACRAEWERRKAENPNDEYGEDYVWDELVQ